MKVTWVWNTPVWNTVIVYERLLLLILVLGHSHMTVDHLIIQAKIDIGRESYYYPDEIAQ